MKGEIDVNEFIEDTVITERLKRINELAAKAKTVGLTAEELAERDKLRKEYLEDFRRRTRGQLENIVFVDEDGNESQLKRKK